MIIYDKKTGNQLKMEDGFYFPLIMDSRIIINPSQKCILELPLAKEFLQKEYVIFEPDMSLSFEGIIIIGHNFNSKESTEVMKIALYNINIDNLLRGKRLDNFPQVFGERGTVDIKPGTILGKIFEIKVKS